MFRRRLRNQEPFTFSQNLKECGFMIDENGRLCYLNGEPYDFHKGVSRRYNTALYDHLFDILTEQIRKTLQHEHGLLEELLPVSATKKDVHSEILVSPDWKTNENMLVFVPCTGPPLGIWSPRVMFDQSIPAGSMLQYTQRALKMGLSLIITNPNEKFWCKGKSMVAPRPGSEFKIIPESSSPESHVEYVFRHFIVPSGAKNIFVIANHYGGHCTIQAIQENFQGLKDRIKFIEFGTSLHSNSQFKSHAFQNWVREHSRNWVNSDRPKGEEIIDARLGCASFSAGCELMDLVSCEIIDAVFSNVQQRIVEPDTCTRSLDTDCLSLDHGCMDTAEKEKLKQQIDQLFHHVQYVDVTSDDTVKFGEVPTWIGGEGVTDKRWM